MEGAGADLCSWPAAGDVQTNMGYVRGQLVLTNSSAQVGTGRHLRTVVPLCCMVARVPNK